MAEETCGFYAGVFLVVTGMIFIVGMGSYTETLPIVEEGHRLRELRFWSAITSWEEGLMSGLTKLAANSGAPNGWTRVSQSITLR